ncbi:MAG: GNAT family N-acetyltransferase [Alphaproteobacteria bacterium]|nr:GNAT family N-acetyltransferase [Alphaproteobacteria bacterium]
MRDAAPEQGPSPDVRDIAPTDAWLLAAMHRESFGKEAWPVEAFTGALAAPARFGFLLRCEAMPAGFVLCQAAGGEAEILTIAVLPRYQRRGFGRRLVQLAVDEARAAGAARILLEVAADNPAAQALYRDTGFADIGARRGYYKRGAVVVDALMLACELNKPI